MRLLCPAVPSGASGLPCTLHHVVTVPGSLPHCLKLPHLPAPRLAAECLAAEFDAELGHLAMAARNNLAVAYEAAGGPGPGHPPYARLMTCANT